MNLRSEIISASDAMCASARLCRGMEAMTERLYCERDDTAVTMGAVSEAFGIAAGRAEESAARLMAALREADGLPPLEEGAR